MHLTVNSLIYQGFVWTAASQCYSALTGHQDSARSALPTTMEGLDRRSFLWKVPSIVLGTALYGNEEAEAVETVGKDPDCNERMCLGVWGGMLADCPHGGGFLQGAGCTSSQDDTPGIFSEP